ncbi:putative methyltransferase [compost metagenome]
MEKLKMHTSNLTAENIEKLAMLFPNCVAETRDEKTGQLQRAIDFDQLRQELSDHIVEGPRERFHLDWPGKREALLAANAPIAKTLRPCREESLEFDSTQNLFIEGDNLDALKLLQETYLGKVKLIYIDPPYNTGNDFIYSDDFAESSADFLLRSNQRDELGNRLIANPESRGRFHSSWLTMMYSRLKLARNLLREDGVLMVSIDDNEFAPLQLVLDEIFGSDNFLNVFVWKRKAGGGDDSDHAATEHEYILCYGRSSDHATYAAIRHESPAMTAKYNRIENGRRYYLERLDKTSLTYSPSMDFEIECPDGSRIRPPQPDPSNPTTIWRWSKTKVEQHRQDLVFERDKKTGEWRIYTKTWISLEGVTPRSLLIDKEHGRNRDGTQDIAALIGPKVFDNPKPLKLLRHLVNIGASEPDAIVLDFFAGSATTGHAVMERNLEDNGTRRFILMQLPAPTNRQDFLTIAEISKARIRAAGADLSTKGAKEIDLGFRVLKVDTSNMKDVYYAPDELSQGQLGLYIDNIKEDRTPEDLLFQVLLDWGVDLSLPIDQQVIAGKTVFFVDGNALAACFDTDISEDMVKELAKRRPLRAVFRDSSYASDSMRINVEQIFKLLSPTTEVRSL